MTQKKMIKPFILREEKGETAKILRHAVIEMGKSGYRIMPSAQSQLAKYLVQAKRKRTLITNQEVAIGVSAFITASANVSTGKRITVKDINTAWNALRRCPGNLPPPKCMRRSIVDHEETLRRELVGFSKLADVIKKEI